MLSRSVFVVTLAATLGLPLTKRSALAGAQAADELQAANEVHALIEKVEQLPSFSKEAVDRLLGTSLKPAANVMPPDPNSLEAMIPRGTFAEVSFREIRPVNGVPSWRLLVTIRESVRIPKNAIDRRLIGRGSITTNHREPENIFTHVILRPTLRLGLGFGMRSHDLKQVGFVRERSPDRAAVEAAYSEATRGSAEVTDTIAKVERLTRFSRMDVEKLLGVALRPSRVSASNPNHLEADVATGLFSQVTYREVVPEDGVTTWVVALTVRKEVSIPEAFFDSKFREFRADVIEDVSKDPILARPVSRLRLGFGMSTGNLRRIVFMRQ